MSETVLYGYWRSSATYRVRIALNLKGVAHRTAGVNLLKDENLSAEHLARHPSGRVPILEIDGMRIGQSMAMIDYLDQTRPDPPLLPREPKVRAHVLDLKDQVVADIHPLNNTSTLARLRSQFGADNAAIASWYVHWIERGFRVLEQMLPSNGGFCVGDGVTLADIVLVPQVANSRRYKVDLAPFPNIARIDASLRELKAFRDAAPENQPEAKSA
ncbi:MAG: maleylacetoacetate isomerase [Alphaproteobacteria bacterium]|nr:maleylacetoacetate isomerase [Alphaproteobacteria bacterium]